MFREGLVRAGVERLPDHQDAPRHQHRQAYVTVVLTGAYEQAAYAGRLRIAAGDVVLQPSFDCHADRMLSAGVELLRLPWTREAGLGGVFSGLPVEEIRRAAAGDIAEAGALVADLISTRTARPRSLGRLSDKLAADLAADPGLRLGPWAARHGTSREGLTRAFHAAFGVSPTRFRVELRARAAWARISGVGDPLSCVAQDLGFADQAHMTRAVRWLTGAPPLAWRNRPAGLAHRLCRP